MISIRKKLTWNKAMNSPAWTDYSIYLGITTRATGVVCIEQPWLQQQLPSPHTIEIVAVATFHPVCTHNRHMHTSCIWASDCLVCHLLERRWDRSLLGFVCITMQQCVPSTAYLNSLTHVSPFQVTTAEPSLETVFTLPLCRDDELEDQREKKRIQVILQWDRLLPEALIFLPKGRKMTSS